MAAAWRLRRWRQHDSATLAAAWRRRDNSGSVSSGGGSATARCWQWWQRASAMLAEAWRRRGGGGSISGGGSSVKRGGGAQRDGSSGVAATRRLRQIHWHCSQMCRCTCHRTSPTRRRRCLRHWSRMEGQQGQRHCRCRQRWRGPWRRPPWPPMRHHH